jgi:hypothetical protein
MKQWHNGLLEDILMVISALMPLVMTTGLVCLIYLVLQ